MLRFLIVLCLTVLTTEQLCSQPYVDPLQVRYTYAFKSNKPGATPYTHLWVGNDIPVKIKSRKNTYILLSPYYEQWRLDSGNINEIYPVIQSVTFPIGLIMPLGQTKWAINIIPVFRTNGEKLFTENTFQYGSILFGTLARKPEQKFRFGIYLNKEFFGWFVIPLIGADWRIDENNYLFGLLPGRLTYEHKWNKKFYGGATFRAITNSYRFTNGEYLRLDDNQISLFADYYLTKHICMTVEPGYGVFRKIRTGINDNRDYLTNIKWGDGPFIKLSVAYRIRL